MHAAPSPSDTDAFTYVLDDDLRILVVDDDPIQREFAQVYISTPTAIVDTADSALEALPMLDEKTFDIVLVDYDMPGMNGLEFIQKVRANPELDNLPIIMVTSHEDVATIDAAYDAGASSFITKPVNWRLLSYQIKYILRGQNQLVAT